MENALYNKSLICPVCGKKIEVTKVKSKSCVIANRDTDFCVYYETVNPLLYDVWVCEYCGYAARGDKFENISSSDANEIIKKITPHWKKRSFSGERTVEKALEAFKLALYNLHIIKSKPSDYAKLCIRIAWIFRILEDEKEKEFISYALKYYYEVYDREELPVGKLDKYTCMYMIGELNRRIGNYDESIEWFNRLVNSSEARNNKVLMESAREQYYVAKKQKQS